MKKFTRILVCLMLCIFTLGIVGCDSRTDKEKAFTYPKYNDEVKGNGGLSVRKGNYIYFVNGYKSVKNLKNENKNDKYTVGSLMLTKLDSNGNIVTEENGQLDDDYYISMCNRLCGYEATDLFIHKDYLYFVSPILEEESGKSGVWAKERTVFYRIKLDKTSKVEEVYRSNVKFDSLEYKYYETKNNLYIVAYEKGNAYYDGNNKNALIRINATTKEVKKTIQNVTSVTFGDDATKVFYVQHDSENEVYDVKQFNALNGESADFINDCETEVTVTMVGKNEVFFTQTHENNKDSITDLMIATFEGKNLDVFLSDVGSNKLSITPDGAVVVSVSGNVISLVKIDQDYSNGGATVTTTIQEAEEVTAIEVIDFTNASILYHATTKDNTQIKLVSYSNALKGPVEIDELTSVKVIDSENAYFDLNEEENCLYFYMKAGKNDTEHYLHKIKVNNNHDEKEQMIGVYASDDVPEVEEEPEQDEEE